MVQSEMHLLFQQMGEVLSGIRGLQENIGIRQAQAEQLHDLVRSDLAELRRDHRDLEEKFDCMVCVMQNDVQALRGQTLENMHAMSALVAAMDGIKWPLHEITAFKSRAAGLLFGLGILGSAALWLAQPIYQWCVNLTLNRR